MNEPQAKQKPTYRVFDSLQRGTNGRKHDVITKFYPKDANGFQPDPETQTYTLFSDAPTEMPMEHAMKFLVDPAFRVISPSGARIMPVARTDLSKPITALKDDEVVVQYGELSKDALFRRVKVLPGSEDIAESAKHQDLVDFMVAWRKSLKGMTEGERSLAEKMTQGEMGGAMTAEQLDSMFPKARITA
jgi:hypothetical protein